VPDPVDRHVGVRIGQRRRELGLSRRALGERVGIGIKQVNKYETAANRVSASRLFAIATALGVTPAYFFEGLPDPGAAFSRSPQFPTAVVADPTPGFRREVSVLVNSYHALAPDIRSRFLRLVRGISEYR
jgi:transcriptional regulator with XRE-family HTH domain